MIFRIIALLCVIVGSAGAQVNLNTSIPAPQVKGIVQPINGGFGLDSSAANGCPKVSGGVWTISAANCGGTASPFSITTFSGCFGALELGATVTNPTFTATYSSPPTSAAITNTDGVNSPTSLTTPFTSGVVVGNFSHAAVATTTFTLSAVGSSTQTATCSDTWNPRVFGGVGTAGATSTVTASGTTAILSNGNVLQSSGLGYEAVGQSFGPYTPSGQIVYLLLMGNSHTFIDANTGFPFAFNAPVAVSFVNANGVTVSMWRYDSTNTLTGNFTPKIVS